MATVFSRIGLPAKVLPIYLTTFVDMLGYTLLIPLLPAIGHKYAAHDWQVGMLISIPAFCATLAAPFWGKTSDRVGRKPIIIIAQVFTLAGYVMLALSPSLFWMYISRIISGIGAGSLGAAESYIADVTHPRERDRAYALYGAVFGAAFIIGPVASGMMEHYGYQLPFWAAACLEVVNIILALFLLPWGSRGKPEATHVVQSLRAAWQERVRVVLLRQFLFVFAVVYLLADFGLYLSRSLHESIRNASWLLAGAGVVGGIVIVGVVTPLSKRFGDVAVGQIGFALLFIAYALIYFVTDITWFFPVIILWAAGASMVEPTLMAILSKRAPKRERGAIMGVGDAVNSVALILAPAIGTAINGEQPRLIGILPAIAIAAAFAIGVRSIRRGAPRPAAS